eukprot:9298882-Pyramimonas_sp.AAC.1
MPSTENIPHVRPIERRRLGIFPVTHLVARRQPAASVPIMVTFHVTEGEGQEDVSEKKEKQEKRLSRITSRQFSNSARSAVIVPQALIFKVRRKNNLRTGQG